MFDIMHKLIKSVESLCSCEKSIAETHCTGPTTAFKLLLEVVIHRHASALDVIAKFACLTLHGSVVRCNRPLVLYIWF